MSNRCLNCEHPDYLHESRACVGGSTRCSCPGFVPEAARPPETQAGDSQGESVVEELDRERLRDVELLMEDYGTALRRIVAEGLVRESSYTWRQQVEYLVATAQGALNLGEITATGDVSSPPSSSPSPGVEAAGEPCEFCGDGPCPNDCEAAGEESDTERPGGARTPVSPGEPEPDSVSLSSSMADESVQIARDALEAIDGDAYLFGIGEITGLSAAEAMRDSTHAVRSVLDRLVAARKDADAKTITWRNRYFAENLNWTRMYEECRAAQTRVSQMREALQKNIATFERFYDSDGSVLWDHVAEGMADCARAALAVGGPEPEDGGRTAASSGGES